MNHLISIPIILSLIVKINASSMSTVTKTESTPTSTSPTSYSYSNSYSHSAQPTTSYYYKLSVPTAYDPYVIQHHDINGTVFISVGTLIISFFMFLLLARFWFYLQNRKAAKNSTDIDEYFGSVYYSEKEDLLNYDSNFLNSRKELSSTNSSSNASFFSNSSTHSSSPINGQNSGYNINNNNSNIHNNLSNLTSQQGRPLRSAMTSNRRNSFISPINELINFGDINNSNENSMFNSPEINSNQNLSPSTLSTPILTNLKHKKAKSIDNLRDKHHSKSASLNLHELEKLVNKSLIEVNLSNPDIHESATSFNIENKVKDKDGDDKKKQRPPSIVLDMLVNDNLDM